VACRCTPRTCRGASRSAREKELIKRWSISAHWGLGSCKFGAGKFQERQVQATCIPGLALSDPQLPADHSRPLSVQERPAQRAPHLSRPSMAVMLLHCPCPKVHWYLRKGREGEGRRSVR